MALGVAFIANSFAQSTNHSLNEVTISASRSDTPLNQMTQNTTLITADDLATSPYQSIDQVLMNIPGVVLNDQSYYSKDPTGQSISMRGLGNSRTLVLIDGVPAVDAMYGTIQWNLIPMTSIESVEIIRGGVSNLYGNYGIGGVINITTKPIKGSGEEVTVSYGTYGTINSAISKETAVDDNLKLRLSADHFQTAGYVQQPIKSPSGTAVYLSGMGPESADSNNYRIAGDVKLSSSTKGNFNLGYHAMNNLPVGGYGFAVKSTHENTATAGTTTQINADEKVKFNAYYEHTTLWQENVSNSPPSSAYISATYMDPYTTYGSSLEYSKNISNFWLDQFIVGADSRTVTNANLTNSLSSSGVNTGVDYARGQQNFYGLMTQFRSKLQVVPLQITFTSRLDEWKSQVPYYMISGANGVNPAYTNAPNQSVTKFSPNLGLLYQPNSSWDIRASAYEGFHTPGLNNMTRTYGTLSSISISNPYLTPEVMNGYEFGADYRWREGFLQLTAFNAFINNAISAITQTSSQLAPYCNSCTGTLYGNNQNIHSDGIELQAHLDINEKWATDESYAYTKTTYSWIGTGVSATANPLGSQIGGVPQNIGSFSLTYSPSSKESYTFSVRYVGLSWLDTAHTLPVDSYYTTGFRANYQVSKDTSIYLSGVNIFNRNYDTFGTGTSASGYIIGQPQTFTVGTKILFN